MAIKMYWTELNYFTEVSSTVTFINDDRDGHGNITENDDNGHWGEGQW